MSAPDVRLRIGLDGRQQVVAEANRTAAEVVGAFRKLGKTPSAALLTQVIEQSRQAGNAITEAGRRTSTAFVPFNRSLSVARGLLAQLGLAFGAGALLSYVRGAASAADETGRLAESAGAATGAIVKLSLNAELVDVQFTQLQTGMREMLERINELRSGESGAAKLFRQLGLSLRDFEGRDAAEQFNIVATAFDRIEDSGLRAALAGEVFGAKIGFSLLPLMRQMAAGGDATANSVAGMFSPAVIRQADDLDDSFKLLSAATQGLAVQFAAGLSGRLSGDLRDTATAAADAASGFLILGDVIGRVFGIFKLGFLLTIGLFVQAVASTQVALQGLWESATLAMTGHFAAAARRLNLITQQIDAIEDHFARQVSSAAKIIASPFQAPREPARRPSSPAERPEQDSIFGKRRAALEAALAKELALVRANVKLRNDEEQRALEQGIVSVASVFAARRRLAQQEADAEIASLRKRHALALQDPDAERGKAEAEKLSGEIAVKVIEARGEQLRLTFDEIQAVRQLASEEFSFRQKLDEATGQAHRARLAEIDAEAKRFEDALIAQGKTLAEARAASNEFREVFTKREDFDQLGREAQGIFDDVERRKRGIQSLVRRGLISELEGERQIAKIERGRIPDLQAIADEMLAIGLFIKDPELIRRAQELNDQIAEMGRTSSELARAIANLGTDVGRALKDSLAGVLQSVGKEIHNVGDFFEDLAIRATDAIQSIISQILAMQAVTAVFKALGLPLPFGEGGEVVRKAGGGFVQGPGTQTSDSIPALLSRDEFVEPAAAVMQPGMLAHLEDIRHGRFGAPELKAVKSLLAISARQPFTIQVNQAVKSHQRPFEGRLAPIHVQAIARAPELRMPTIQIPQRFAGGGLAMPDHGPAQARISGEILVSAAPGSEILDIRTPEGERQVLKILAKNPRAARRNLGG